MVKKKVGLKSKRKVKVKRKLQRGAFLRRSFVNISKFNWLSGGYLLKCNSALILSKQALDAAFLTLKRTLKKEAYIVQFVNPNRTVTKRSAGVRMGKGKGSKFSGSVCSVRCGSIIFGIFLTNSMFDLVIDDLLSIVGGKLGFNFSIVRL